MEDNAWVILKEIQSFFSPSNLFFGFFKISFYSLLRWHMMHLMHLSTFFEPCMSCRWKEQILFSWKFKRGKWKSGSSRETVVRENLKSWCWIEILPRIRFGFHVWKSKEIKLLLSCIYGSKSPPSETYHMLFSMWWLPYEDPLWLWILWAEEESKAHMWFQSISQRHHVLTEMSDFVTFKSSGSLEQENS